jgi:hypothetical protein
MTKMSTKPTPEQLERIRYYQFLYGMSEQGAFELVQYEDDESRTMTEIADEHSRRLKEQIHRNLQIKRAEKIGK